MADSGVAENRGDTDWKAEEIKRKTDSETKKTQKHKKSCQFRFGIGSFFAFVN